MHSTRPLRCARRSRRAVTLLELVVVLALLGVVAALVLPALASPPSAMAGGRLSEVVRAARSAAIARAQLLELTVAADGRWTLRPRVSLDTTVVLDGQLTRAPFAALQLQFTPVGACLPVSALPRELGGWDVASCTPRRAEAPGS